MLRIVFVRFESLSQRNVQGSTFIESSESEAKLVPLKSSAASIMHACESLAAGACRKRYFRDHLRAHQWAATEGSAVESPGRCLVRRGVNGCNRRNDAGARISRNQLRHSGAAARHDAYLGVSLYRAFFRMGGRTGLEILANAGAAAA